MWEAAEARDDVAVRLRVAEVEVVIERADERDRALLIGEVLGVLEGQVHEDPERPASSRVAPLSGLGPPRVARRVRYATDAVPGVARTSALQCAQIDNVFWSKLLKTTSFVPLRFKSRITGPPL